MNIDKAKAGWIATGEAMGWIQGDAPAVPLPDPEPQVDPDQLVTAQSEVDRLRKALKGQQDAKVREDAAGAPVPHRAKTIAQYTAQLTAAVAALAALTGGAEAQVPEGPSAIPEDAIRVNGPDDLPEALEDMAPGDTLFLAPGDYDSFKLTDVYDPPVTIMAAGDAVFEDISVDGGGGVTLVGLRSTGIWFDDSANVRALRCTAQQIKADGCTDVVIRGNRIADGHICVRIASTQRFEVEGNRITGAREDTFRITGNSAFGTVRSNVLLDNRAAMPIHGDHIQMFGGKDGMPHDIVIEGNLIHDDNRGKAVFHMKDGSDSKGSWKAGDKGTPAPAQGIFMKDGTGNFERITVRRNLLRTAMLNTIYTPQGAKDFLIAENILFPVPGKQRVSIRLAKIANGLDWSNAGVVVTRNITPSIREESPEADVREDNWLYGDKADPDTFFAGMTLADSGGAEPEDWLPKAGSPVPVELIGWLPEAVKALRGALEAAPA